MLGDGARNRLVLNLGSTLPDHEVRPAAEPDEDVSGNAAAVPAVTRRAGNVVEDRAQPFGDGEGAPELDLSVLEIAQLPVVQPLKRLIEPLSVRGRRSEELVAAHADYRERANRNGGEAAPSLSRVAVRRAPAPVPSTRTAEWGRNQFVTKGIRHQRHTPLKPCGGTRPGSSQEVGQHGGPGFCSVMPDGDAARPSGRGSIHPNRRKEEGALPMKALALALRLALPIVMALLAVPISAAGSRLPAAGNQLSEG